MRFIIFLHCFFVLLGTEARPLSPIDSLKNLLKTQAKDSRKVRILNYLSEGLSLSQPEESRKYAEEALQLATSLEDQVGVAASYRNIGIYARNTGDYINSLEHLLKALDTDKAVNYNTPAISKSLENIGLTLMCLKNYEEAQEYFLKSLEIHLEIKDSLGVAMGYTHLGEVAEKQKNYAQAINYHLKSLGIGERIKSKNIHFSLQNLGNIYANLSEYDKAVAYFQQSLALRNSSQNNLWIAETLVSLGESYLLKKDFLNASICLEKGLALSKNARLKETEENAYRILMSYYEQQGNYQQAFLYSQKKIQLSDSLYNSEVNKRSSILQRKFQESKLNSQERENKFLKKTKEQLDISYDTQRQISTTAIISGVTSLFLAVVLFFALAKNQSIARLLAAKNKEIETQHEQLLEQHDQIIDAQTKLEEMNDELQGFNVHLEGLVVERTEKSNSASEALQIAKHELELFMYRISHDFRGPLATLTGLANVGKLEIETPKALIFFEQTELTSLKMSKMLDRLVMVNTITQQSIRKKTIDFQEIFTNVLKNLRVPAHAVSLSLAFKDKTFWADADMVEIVLKNLIENALQFSKPDSQHQVEVIIERNIDFVKITVEDNGVGIAKEYRQKMFEMFFRASESSQGNGLGLYIVKKAVEKLQGEIVVESELNEFARFMVMLPYQTEKLS